VPELVFWILLSSKRLNFFLHRKSVEWTLLSRGVPGLVFLDPVVFKETEFFLHRKSVEWNRLIRLRLKNVVRKQSASELCQRRSAIDFLV
ncbi:hypothetical protein AVEN_9118-1, partial [Araneus ventricosus]